MNIEEGLLSRLMESIKSELQGLIRYEICRGLDKPEANSWVCPVTNSSSLSEFLDCNLQNSLYPKETITAKQYLQRPIAANVKFKFLKENGSFYLPSDQYLTQAYLNDLLSGVKNVLMSSQINSEELVFAEIKAISHLFVANESISMFLPSSFTAKNHDADYVTSVFLTLDFEGALQLFQQFKIHKEIASFRLEKQLSVKIAVIKPMEIKWESLSQTVNNCMSELKSLNLRQFQLKAIADREEASRNIITEITKQSFNDSMFESYLEASV